MAFRVSTISFVVYGIPQPAGSKRAFPIKRAGGKIGVAVSDANPRSRDWKNAVASAAREHYSGPLLDEALCLDLRFYLPRPKGHFGKKGLLPSAPAFPTGKPDALKLARAVEDSLTGVVWRDDSRVVAGSQSKEYGEPARVEIALRGAQSGCDAN